MARTAGRTRRSNACALARPASPVSPSRAASSLVTFAGARETITYTLRARRRSGVGSAPRVRSRAGTCEAAGCPLAEIAPRAARDDGVQQITLPECLMTRAQELFLQARETALAYCQALEGIADAEIPRRCLAARALLELEASPIICGDLGALATMRDRLWPCAVLAPEGTAPARGVMRHSATFICWTPSSLAARGAISAEWASRCFAGACARSNTRC